MTELPATPRKIWVIISMMMTFAFLIPALLMMNSAAKPSARAAFSAKHGLIQMDNEEGALLFQAMQIHEGKSIYHPLKDYPFVAGTYTPLFMATVAVIDNFHPPSLETGRIIAWLSALGIGIIIVLLTAMATRNGPVGILAGFLFLATWEVYRWIGYFRVDFPAIFLSLAGLCFIVLARGKAWSLAVGALFMVLGLYTKQTVIAAPAACLVALLFQKPRQALLFFGWLIVWGLPPLIILEIMTGGEFLRHTILYNMNEWQAFNLKVWSRHVWNMHRWFFIAGLPALPWLFWQMGRDRRGAQSCFHGFWQPLAWYGLFALWNFFAIAKAGSAENYLLEPLAGWAMIVCLAVGGLVRDIGFAEATWRRWFSTGSALIFFGLITTHALVITYPESQAIRFSPLMNPGRSDFEAAQVVRGLVRNAKRPYCELALYQLGNRKNPIVQPFIMSELARQGRWDQSKFVHDIRTAQFDVAITLEDVTGATATDIYTQEMLNAFHDSYKELEVLHTPQWQIHILVPRTESDTVSGEEFTATVEAGRNDDEHGPHA